MFGRNNIMLLKQLEFNNNLILDSIVCNEENEFRIGILLLPLIPELVNYIKTLISNCSTIFNII